MNDKKDRQRQFSISSYHRRTSSSVKKQVVDPLQPRAKPVDLSKLSSPERRAHKNKINKRSRDKARRQQQANMNPSTPQATGTPVQQSPFLQASPYLQPSPPPRSLEARFRDLPPNATPQQNDAVARSYELERTQYNMMQGFTQGLQTYTNGMVATVAGAAGPVGASPMRNLGAQMEANNMPWSPAAAHASHAAAASAPPLASAAKRVRNAKNVAATPGNKPPRPKKASSSASKPKSTKKAAKVAKSAAASKAKASDEESSFGKTIRNVAYGFGNLPSESTPLDNEWDYKTLFSAIDSLLEANPGCNLYLFSDKESKSVASSFVQFDVLKILVAKEAPPKLVRLKNEPTGAGEVDTHTGVEGFKTFDDLGLDWVGLDRIKIRGGAAVDKELITSFSNKCKGRLFVLQYTGRATKRAISEELQSQFKRANLLDCRPSIFPERKADGDIRVAAAAYSFAHENEVYHSTYTLGGGKKMEIVGQIEKLGVAPADYDTVYHTIEEALQAGFAEQRARIQSVVNGLQQYDTEDLEGIRVAKVYPSNFATVVPSLTRHALELYHTASKPSGRKDKNRTKEEAEAVFSNWLKDKTNNEQDLEAALASFVFKGNDQVTEYGPVALVFDHQTDV